MHNHASGQKKSLPLTGIRCRTAGGSASIKKGSTANTALLVWVDSYRPFGSMLEQSTSLFKSLDSGSWHNLTSPETSPFSQVIPALPKYKTAITATIHISVFNILRDLLFGYPSFSFFRCSAMSLRPQASSTQAEKLALGLSGFSRSTLASISSINSCGKRIPLYADLLFLCPVAMSSAYVVMLGSHDNTGRLKTSEVFKHKTIDVLKHHDVRYLNTLSTGKAQETHKITKPGGASTLTGPLTKPLIEVTIMADNQSTQTHPKFTFLFLAVRRSDVTDRPHRHQVTAPTYDAARRLVARDYVAAFAGRLPVREVRNALPF